ncbi:hypothetical protein ACFL31_02070 [Candidatus Margulisiibacteriota bacterium]
MMMGKYNIGRIVRGLALARQRRTPGDRRVRRVTIVPTEYVETAFGPIGFACSQTEGYSDRERAAQIFDDNRDFGPVSENPKPRLSPASVTEVPLSVARRETASREIEDGIPVLGETLGTYGY